MRVNQTCIKNQIITDYNMLTLKIQSPFEDFLSNITISQYDQWNTQQLSNRYNIKTLERNVVKFEYLTILIETDHKDLIEVIEHILAEFVAYSIEYPIKYEPQIQVFKDDLAKHYDCFLTPSVTGTLFNTLTFYYHSKQSLAQELEYKINRLKEFKEEILIYAINDDLKCRIELKNNSDVKHFLNQLVKYYAGSIIQYINHNMEKIGMKANIIIEKIDYFLKDQQNKLKEHKIDISGFSGNSGLIFVISGFQESFCKMYEFVQKWIQKLSAIIIQVEEIECCKEEMLEKHFNNTYSTSHAVLLQPGKDEEALQRILIFQPSENVTKNELLLFFKTTKRIITGLEYQKYNFPIIFEMWNEFVGDSRLSINASPYEDYLIVNCTKGQEKRLRQKIRHFLQDYQTQEAKITVFSSLFEISLFQSVFIKSFPIRHVSFYIENDSLYRKNFIKDTEAVDQELREFYSKMKKGLVHVPILRTLPIKKPYFKQLRAIQWENTECFENLQFKIEEKVTINIRSFESISRNEKDCIFIVEDIRDSIQLLDILKAQGCANVEQKIENNPILGFSLKFCNSFDNITACKVTIRNARENKWIKRLKQTFESMIENHISSRHLKFMFHRNSQDSIKVLIPIIINSICSNCNLRAESKIKEVTFFISLNDGSHLRQAIISNLREVREKNVAISKISQITLRESDLQKIVTYGYYTLKYFQDEVTREASPLNSFIFQTEWRKKKKTPIFLPSQKQIQNKITCQFLFNCSNGIIYKVINRRIIEIKEKNETLLKIKTILKKYFPAIEYFVINGNEAGTEFSQRLFYTSTEQKLYKTLQRVKLDLKDLKITIEKVHLKFQFIKNEFISLKKIETHYTKKQELLNIMNGVSLQ